ncbi:MAG: DUF4157 domain-containing protein [Prolixibacteraceae bacterium]|nr:DUF4157 domain-containing protein [Prolixibacteraceae bacterium]
MQEEEEEEPIQMQVEEEEEEPIQASEIADRTVAPSPSTIPIESSIRDSRGNGSQLPDDVRSRMENGLGINLSGVRIHTDSNAQRMTEQLRAQAFTNKNNIYFNQGRYNPGSQEGQHLLAHELTHSVQQGGIQVSPGSTPQSEAENENPAVANTGAQPQTESQTSAAQNGLNQTQVREDREQQTGADEQSVSTDSGIQSELNIPVPTQHDNVSQNNEQREQVQDNYPRSPQEDPNFQAAERRVSSEASTQQTTRSATQEAQAAQGAAISPENERQSQAQSEQVNTMEQQEPGEFDAAAFKQKLMERINSMQLPQNQEQASNFEDNNNIEEVSQAAQGDVSQEQTQAAGPIERTTSQPPNTDAIPQREVKPLPDPDVCRVPAPIEASKAMPRPRPGSQIDVPLQENTQEVSQAMAENEITDEQLEKSNEPQFTSALNSKKTAQIHAQSAPGQFRNQEQQTLSGNQQQTEINSNTHLLGMHTDRVDIATQVNSQQTETGTQDSAERNRIATEINTLYESTKTDVEKILTDLDESVAKMFRLGAENAKQKFEAHVEGRMNAYKRSRYSGLRGAARWVRDKFMGIPDEVNEYFSEGREKYIASMDVTLTNISQYVALKLTEAKTRITLGKQEVSDYVIALPQSLQNIGKEASERIQNRFDDLENSVDSKQDELIDSLAQQYNESLQTVDARIDEMKAANRGLVDKALDAVKGVINIIIAIKNVLTNLLSSAISVIKTIISDPIGFLGNLISGVAQGFRSFGANILKHLTSGLIGWLTGALGPMGITLSNDIFSLKGIFSLVMQVLGLTWDYIRKKAVKLLGEPIVKALETGFEIFKIIRKDGIAGLWNYIKQQFNDLKETVIGAIKQMIITKVIEAGIKWVLGLMSPAGAFVKAAMMIIDIVRFFIERGSQIIQLVRAFIDGVKAVATGSVSKVANAIENALSMALPVVIGFLASLLGIGGLASKVKKLIRRIRKRIDKAIDKIILKAKKWFKKAGKKVKGAVGKFVKWWKAKKSFKGKDGKNHNLYFSGDGNSAKLMVASNPTAFTDFIISVEVGTDKKKKSAKQQALTIAGKIDAKKREAVAGANETEKNKNSEKKQKDLNKLLADLAKHAQILFGTAEGDLPASEISYGSANKGGDIMGTQMTAKILTKKGDAGSVPTSRKHVAFDKLLKRRLGGSSYYIRGHLLNHNTHGPGKWTNMTPLSKEGNRLHESVAESKVKAAVSSGSIVYYFVKPVYGRGALNTPENADPKVKEIRSAEKYVPHGLEVEAHTLKPKTENFAKKQNLVPKQTIRNPIDTSIGNYQLTSTSKDRVVLLKDKAQTIVDNTGGVFSLSRIQQIKIAANSVENLSQYDQIKEKTNSDVVKSDIDKLRTMDNVVLK